MVGVVVGASVLNDERSDWPELAPDTCTCNLIEERILQKIDELEDRRDVGDVSGLTTALWIIRDIAEE